MVRVLIKEIEEYARVYGIPIMEQEGIEFLLQYIKKNNIMNILEIGTAIGYSAIRMASLDPKIHVTTIERDQNRYLEAKKNVEKANLSTQITLLLKDALEIESQGKFDLIFIDAAKSQYIKFFEKYESNLTPKGTIVSDNINFHGLTKHPNQIKSKNLRSMVNKIILYQKFLKENQFFQTTFYDVGDGIAVSIKK